MLLLLLLLLLHCTKPSNFDKLLFTSFFTLGSWKYEVKAQLIMTQLYPYTT